MSPGAGAASPEPPSVREPKAAGAWPQAHSQGPRRAGAGVPSSAGSLNPTSPGLAARPVRTHLLLSRMSAVGPRGCSGGGVAVLSQDHQADSGALLHFSLESSIPQPAAGRAGVLLSSLRRPGCLQCLPSNRE